MEKLKLLFEKARIKYIVSVDDCYNPDIQLEKFEVSRHLSTHVEIAIAFSKEIGLDDFESTLSSLGEHNVDYIESVVDLLTDNHVSIFHKKFYNPENIEKSGLENFCQDLKDKNIIFDFKKISTIGEAASLHDNLQQNFNISHEQRVLWMIDDDFQKAGGSAKDGTNLIKTFVSNHKANNIYALTSGQLGDMENETFRSYLSTNPSEGLLACIIHKHQIIDKSYTELYNQMYFGFRGNYSGTIVSQIKDTLLAAAANAGTTIESIEDEAIHKVFFLASKSEGTSPLDTFQRLMMIILKTDISKKLCENYDSISKLIYDYSNLCSWCDTENNNENDIKIIRQLRAEECYDFNINSMYSPVSYGDIFTINNKNYFLINQSCNIVIRSNGQRKSQCATLLLIENNINFEDSNFSLSHYELKHFKNNRQYCISYNKAINIDFSVLDLCCLNSDGYIRLENDFNFESVKYRYSVGMAIGLTSSINHNIKLSEEYNLIEANKSTFSVADIISKVRNIYKDNSTELQIEFIDGVHYNGKRTCRLNQNITDDICGKYSEYHSRKGLDFDFTANYNIIEFDLIYDFKFSLIGLNDELVKQNLLTSYNYFDTTGIKKDKIKEDIEQKFLEYYSKNVLNSEDSLMDYKIDHKNKSIKIKPILIPVFVDGNILYDVFATKKNHVVIKIPKKYIENLLVTKSTGSYPRSKSPTKMIISNSDVKFEFESGQALTYNDLTHVNKIIEFKFTINGGIHMNF